MKAIKAKTHEELERYCNVWLPVWIESNYELESYINKGIERVIFSTENEEDIACFELIPYSFEHSSVNDNFPFNQYQFLKNKKVYEIDKLVIKNEYRGSIKRLNRIFEFIAKEIILDKDCDYLIALINPDLYDTLLWRLKLPIRKLIVNHNVSLNYIPVMLEVETLRNSPLGKKIYKKHLQTV